VIDSKGNQLTPITDPTINGPWDMTVDDRGNNVTAFVSNAFAGTVVRLDLRVGSTGVTVMSKTVIASGYQHQSDPSWTRPLDQCTTPVTTRSLSPPP